MLLYLVLAAIATKEPSSTILVASAAKDFLLTGGAQVTANPLTNLRSGNPQQRTVASFAVPLTLGVSISSISFSYRYMTGFGPSGVGSNFSLVVAGRTVYRSPHLTDHIYSKSSPTNYSTVVGVAAANLSLSATAANNRVSLVFDNNDRNLQLLLPLKINVSCTGSPGGSCAAYPLLPTALASNMVLQRAPARAAIWGLNAHPGEKVTVRLSNHRGATTTWSTTAAAHNGSWSIAIDPQPVSVDCTIEVSTSGGRSQVLTNVAFGDVYLCSGQSNMEFSTNRAFNASAEIADADRFMNIRMFTVAHAVANSPQTEVADKTGGTGIYRNSSWAGRNPPQQPRIIPERAREH